MKIYEIPIIVRYTYIGDENYVNFSKSKCLVINNLGMIVYYDKEEQLVELQKTETLKFFEEKGLCFIEAEDHREAIIKFFLENKETAIGGNTLSSRAVYINKKEIILEFPFCPLIHKNKYGMFICGLPSLCGGIEGDFGICAIENNTPPEDCTFVFFKYRFLVDYKKYERVAGREFGFKVLRSNQVEPDSHQSPVLNL